MRVMRAMPAVARDAPFSSSSQRFPIIISSFLPLSLRLRQCEGIIVAAGWEAPRVIQCAHQYVCGGVRASLLTVGSGYMKGKKEKRPSPRSPLVMAALQECTQESEARQGKARRLVACWLGISQPPALSTGAADRGYMSAGAAVQAERRWHRDSIVRTNCNRCSVPIP